MLRPVWSISSGRSLRAWTRVIKSGRTLTIVQDDVDVLSGAGDVHVLTGLVTMMLIERLAEGAF